MEKQTRQLCRVPGAQQKTHFGKIYILSDNRDIETAFKTAFGESDDSNYYLKYAPVCISNMCDVTDAALAEKASSLRANVFSQVFMPDQDVPMFLFEKVDNATLVLAALNMVSAAEYIAQKSVCSAIRNYALNDPDNCAKWFASFNCLEYNEVADTSFKGVCCTSAEVSPNQARMMNDFNDGRVNFVQYVQDIKNAKSENVAEIEKKVKLVLNIFTKKEKDKIVELFFKEMSDEKLAKFYGTYVDPTIPSRSMVKLSVEESKECVSNDGYYRLYYKFTDTDKHQLHFKNKPACIVYLMLLLYKKKYTGPNAFFSFDKNNAADKDLFVKLMASVYGKNAKNAGQDYDSLFRYEGIQGRLKDWIGACETMFKDTIGDYESWHTFTPEKQGDEGYNYTLPINPDNIIFPEGFTERFPM